MTLISPPLPLPRFVISPPFGNYFNFPNSIPIRGSFTVDPRPGKINQILKTLRWVPGGYRNNIGLRNPGITHIKFDPSAIYSLAAVKPMDWEILSDLVPETVTCIELNLSCPNIDEAPKINFKTLERFVSKHKLIIAKLSPNLSTLNVAYFCLYSGIKYLHFSNTLPSPKGGISGEQLRKVNLPLIEQAAKLFPEAKLIAGGGIYTPQHITDYHNACSAETFSLATVCFNYFKARKLVGG